MGRPRSTHPDLPPRLRVKDRRYLFELWTKPGEPRRWKNLGRDRAAALAAWAVLYAEGTGAPPPAAADTLDTVAGRYRREVLPGKATKTAFEQGKELTRLVAAFGHIPVGAIEPQHVRQYLDARKAAPVAANREKALLSHVLTKAREWGVMAGANPCAGIRGHGEKARTRYVSDAELSTVILHADAPLAAILRLAYLTAQRPADVLKLRRADIRDGFLHVEQNKTGAKLRIAVEGELAALVDDLLARRPVVKGKTMPPTPWLVFDERGGPVTAGSLRTRFERAREASGVDFQFRDLRAKAGTDAASLGDAQALLGHAAATTTDRYVRRRAGVVVRPIARKV